MKTYRFLTILLAVLLLGSILFGGFGRAQSVAAAPTLPTDESKVPHYFGPNPNWALSPLRLANVAVTLTGGGGIRRRGVRYG